MMDWNSYAVRAEASIERAVLRCRLIGQNTWPKGTQFAYYLYCNNQRIATRWYTREDSVMFPLAGSGAYYVAAFLRVGQEPPFMVKSNALAFDSVAAEGILPRQKLSIFGSCVSRDLLEYSENLHFVLDAYIARQSVVSAVSAPIPCRPEEISLESRFQRQQVYHDVAKDTFDVLSESQSDYLMIDLIDERFDLGAVNGSVVTLSNEMVACGYRAGEIRPLNRRYDRNTKEYWIGDIPLKRYMDGFLERILGIFPEDRIIVHKALFVNSYLNKKGRVKKFNASYRGRNGRDNNMLRFMYEYMQSSLPRASTIDLCGSFHADESHKWGLAPMHYQSEYYRAALAQMERIIEK